MGSQQLFPVLLVQRSREIWKGVVLASGLEAAHSHTDNERHAQEADCKGQGRAGEGQSSATM